RAPVADEVVAERFEVLGQAGPVEVLGHDLRAGGERRLHPRLDLQALLDRVAREDPAPNITDGLDVFVQLVIAAITTWPWSSSVSVPSASVTGTRLAGRAATCAPPVAPGS